MARLPLLAIAIFVTLTPSTSAAQEARLRERLDPETSRRIEELVLVAAAEGLPTELLIQKAFEGVAKGAPPGGIVSAVDGLAHRLREARDLLGEHAGVADLAAAAATLLAGLDSAGLSPFREVSNGDRARALTAVTGLIGSGVAPGDAAVLVRNVVAAGGDAETLMLLNARVSLDVRAGVPPAEAARARSASLMRNLTPGLSGDSIAGGVP